MKLLSFQAASAVDLIFSFIRKVAPENGVLSDCCTFKNVSRISVAASVKIDDVRLVFWGVHSKTSTQKNERPYFLRWPQITQAYHHTVVTPLLQLDSNKARLVGQGPHALNSCR